MVRCHARRAARLLKTLDPGMLMMLRVMVQVNNLNLLDQMRLATLGKDLVSPACAAGER